MSSEMFYSNGKPLLSLSPPKQPLLRKSSASQAAVGSSVLPNRLIGL
jgi:hypothetical protein